jgi:hypothetical protein
MIIAEGFGTASNGAVTAIGVNQRIIVAPELPANSKRGVMAHFTEVESNLGGQDLEVSITVSDPSGKAIVANIAPARLSQLPQWPDVPPGVDIFLDIPLRLSEYGAYEIKLSVKLANTGDAISGYVFFYVQRTPDPASRAIQG